MYRVIGKDGKEYGPASADDLRLWIAQRRIDAESRIRPEGELNWGRLGDWSDFADALGLSAIPPAFSIAPPALPPKVSGLAITSLILGLLGFVTVGLTAIPGVVLGVIALIKVRRNPSRLTGAGLAIAGICVSAVTVVLLPIMAALLLPALAKAKSKATTVQCMNHVKQINLALMMYATDNRNKLPSADKWCDLIAPYLGTSTPLHCPAQPGKDCSYTFNASLANQEIPKLAAAARTVLVFSSDEGWNKSGRADQLASHRHDRRFYTVGFADGHVEVVRAERTQSWIWEP